MDTLHSMRTVSKVSGCLVALCLGGLLAGCEYLPALGLTPPTVEFKDVALVQSPSQRMVAAYVCPKAVPDVGGLPGSSLLLCSGFFGGVPNEQQMQVGFRTHHAVENPNSIPIPVTEMLTAVTLFPSQTQQKLGASCVVFCDADDVACTGQAGVGACQSSDADIKSLGDFAGASSDVLISQGIQLAQNGKPHFNLPQVNAQSQFDLNALFALGPQPVLDALVTLAGNSVTQLASGEEVTFQIPYQMEGTVWLNVGALGKVALPYGPVDGTFTVPVQALVPDF